MLDLQADNAIFVSDFGEPVRFRRSPIECARELKATLNRQPISDEAESPFAGTRLPTLHLLVRNGMGGVQPCEITEDESEIEVAANLGDEPRWRKILRVLRQNRGCILLEVQL